MLAHFTQNRTGNHSSSGLNGGKLLGHPALRNLYLKEINEVFRNLFNLRRGRISSQRIPHRTEEQGSSVITTPKTLSGSQV